jgi:hypothetical protein
MSPVTLPVTLPDMAGMRSSPSPPVHPRGNDDQSPTTTTRAVDVPVADVKSAAMSAQNRPGYSRFMTPP